MSFDIDIMPVRVELNTVGSFPGDPLVRVELSPGKQVDVQPVSFQRRQQDVVEDGLLHGQLVVSYDLLDCLSTELLVSVEHSLVHLLESIQQPHFVELRNVVVPDDIRLDVLFVSLQRLFHLFLDRLRPELLLHLNIVRFA